MVLTVPHNALNATIRFTSNLNGVASLESFGVRNIRLVSGDLLVGTGTARWAPGPADFTRGLEDWRGFALRNETCDSSGVALVTTNFEQTYMFKTFTDLPAHNAIKVEAIIVHRNSNGSQTVRVQVDNSVEGSWSRVVPAQTTCGLPSDVDQVFVTALHTAASTTIRISIDGTGNTGLAVLSMTVMPITLGSADWSTRTVSFDQGLGAWYGDSIKRASCRGGTVLGAPGILGVNTKLTAVWTGIPAHRGLLLRMVFYNWGTWDTEEQGQVRTNEEPAAAAAEKSKTNNKKK